VPLRDETPLPVLFAWAETAADALAREGLQAAALVRPREQFEAQAGGFESDPAIFLPAWAAPGRFIDRVEVNVHVGADFAAAVRFVCPDHKADSDAALAFAVGCAALLYEGVGLLIVDAVPGPPAWATHLHSLAAVYPAGRRPPARPLSALAVRPAFRSGGAGFDVWHFPLQAGRPLPTVTIPLRGPMPELDLEATYTAAVGRG
jgi:hypothetical protein